MKFPGISYNSKPQGEGHINTAIEMKGKNSCLVLAESENESKELSSASAKASKILLENYLRRPSLSDEAMIQLANFANDGIFAMQSPQYRTQCSAGALFIHKDSYRFLGFGTVRAFHFVNGQIMHAYPEKPTESLGARQHIDVITQPSAKFGKGENSFLICSSNFASAITPDELEESLAEATTAEHWMTILRNLFEHKAGSDEEYSLSVLFMPPKKERPSKAKTITIVLVILALLVAAFLGMGALRRSQGPGPEGMPGMPGGMPGIGAPASPTPPAPPEDSMSM